MINLVTLVVCIFLGVGGGGGGGGGMVVGKAGGGGKRDSRGKGFVGYLHVSVLNPRKGRDQDWKGRGGMGWEGMGRKGNEFDSKWCKQVHMV